MATGVACQQGTLTLPDTWFRPPFWDLLMLQLLRPNSSNLPCLYSTFHLEYPLVLSRFCYLCKHTEQYFLHFFVPFTNHIIIIPFCYLKTDEYHLQSNTIRNNNNLQRDTYVVLCFVGATKIKSKVWSDLWKYGLITKIFKRGDFRLQQLERCNFTTSDM